MTYPSYLLQNPHVGMDDSIAGPQDGNSDYGSDFTPEQDEILNRLLQPLPPKLVPDLELLLADLSNDENPHAARTPYHVRYESQERSRDLVERRKDGKSQISVKLETSCKLRPRWRWRGKTN